MRIISKFHDYYDSAMGFGHDNTFIYKRETSDDIFIESSTIHEIVEDCPKNYITISSNKKDPVFDYQFYVIGFCGKIYPLVKLMYINKQTKPSTNVERYCYTIDGIKEFMVEYKLESKLRLFTEKLKNYIHSKWYRQNVLHHLYERDVSDFFGAYYGSEKYDNLFIEHNVPIFVIAPVKQRLYSHQKAKSELILNPSLKDFEFFKVFDAYAAFQEVDMFLSGVLGNIEKDTVDISDKDMLLQKGFDDMSFKKYPTKKK